MFQVKGTYHKGKIKLNRLVKTDKPVEVTVIFSDEKLCDDQRLSFDMFSFDETQKLLKNSGSSLSNAIIEERRSEL